MGSGKKLFHFLIIFLVLVAVVVAFQNCQQSDIPYSAIQNSSRGPTPMPSSAKVYLSKNTNFSTEDSFYNYSDTLYQKVVGLGPQGTACPVDANQDDGNCLGGYLLLSTLADWTYNSSRDEWTSSLPVKAWHGRTWRLYYKVQGELVPLVKSVSVQSIAQATTTDVVVFTSLDSAGLNVIGPNIKQNQAFYSHIKNGTPSSFICQYVSKCASSSGCQNPGTLTNPTNFCSSTTPSTQASIWASLANTTPVNNGGNTTMMSYFNAANTYHITDTLFYVFKDNVKTQGFSINHVAP